jgi:hypothetical protein
MRIVREISDFYQNWALFNPYRTCNWTIKYQFRENVVRASTLVGLKTVPCLHWDCKWLNHWLWPWWKISASQFCYWRRAFVPAFDGEIQRLRNKWASAWKKRSTGLASAKTFETRSDNQSRFCDGFISIQVVVYNNQYRDQDIQTDIYKKIVSQNRNRSVIPKLWR